MKSSCSISERAGRRWRRVPKWGSGSQLGLFLRALAFGVSVRWLRRLKWSRLHGLLERRFRNPSKADLGNLANVSEGELLRCLENALSFGRPLVQGDCLTYGLTRYYFLRRANVPVTLCFGVPRKGGELAAGPGHCWLERDGEPFLEGKDPRAAFLPIHRLPFREAEEARGGKVSGETANDTGRTA